MRVRTAVTLAVLLSAAVLRPEAFDARLPFVQVEAQPLAAAWTAGEGPTRARVSAAFAAIMTRDGLTRRHAAVKDVIARWPKAAVELLGRRS